MKRLWRIKWELIIFIVLFITMTFCWIAFLMIPTIYTLAVATIQSFMCLIVSMDYEAIKEFRHDVIKNWE